MHKIVTLAAKLLSGWRVPTLKDAKTLVAAVLAQTPYKRGK